MQAFILAGGFATRLWPLTEKRAKPLLPLAGKPLLTHLVEKIPEGIPITVSTNQVFAKDFESWRSDVLRQAQHDVSILIEDTGHEDEKLGALGAVAKWIEEENISDDVLLLAGDNYVGFSIAEFLKGYQGYPLLAIHDIGDKERAKRLGTVILEQKYASIHPEACPELAEWVSSRVLRSEQSELRSVSRDETVRVQAFEEKPQNPRSTLVSTGCSILPKETLSALLPFAKEHPDNIGGIFEHLLRQGTAIHGIVFGEPWFDIGSFEAYLDATKALVGNDVRRGMACHAPTDGNIFEGSVVIGDRSTVKRSTLRNVVLFEDCSIEDCVLENCILDNHCVLKGVDLTGKMLRAGTALIREITNIDIPSPQGRRRG